MPSRWSDYARRLPSSLKDLSGPATGMVVLPLHAAWSGRRAYDVSDERQRLMLYALPLAGGYAFRAHEIVYRPSQDLDFATGSHEPLPDIAGHVRQAFASAGYGTRVVEATGRYAPGAAASRFR